MNVVASLTEKLKGLYARAILRPEEENDSGRMNEARNAAFLLIKLARENGVQLKFVVNPSEKVTEDASRPSPVKPEGPKRYERPKPAAPPTKKRANDSRDYDAEGWKTCPCGKPIATRTWYSPYAGCTHVEHAT